MKVSLYAIQVGNSCEWRISIDTEIDFGYWFKRYTNSAQILLIEGIFSLGQAIDFRARYMINLQKEKKHLLYISKTNANFFYHVSAFQLYPLSIHSYRTMSGNIIQIKTQKVSYLDWVTTKRAPIQLNRTIYQELLKHLEGRALLIGELEQLIISKKLMHTIKEATPYIQYAYLCGHIQIKSGISMKRIRNWRSFWKVSIHLECIRCGSQSEKMYKTDCHYCASECYYCEACLSMGKNRFCSMIIYGQSKINKKQTSTIKAQYQKELDSLIMEKMKESTQQYGLSQAQSAASLEGLLFMNSRQRHFLIWAVTGAGKTEMIFPFIHYELQRGGKVLLATPRKDVVLELVPRIQSAFSSWKVIALYGGSAERFDQANITIATTHQLFRFSQAFDLAIIDEMDAFPYHNNSMLTYATNRVVKSQGHYILLSATPPTQYQKAAKSGKLPHVKVPVRYHRYPLPIPKIIRSLKLKEQLAKKSLPEKIKSIFIQSIHRGAQIFVFVPAISYVSALVQLLRKELLLLSIDVTEQQIEGTSSKDAERASKVTKFRLKCIRILVTTTILERGVTIPYSDVIIFDADASLFDAAALIQMSGRAGRSKEDPKGNVYFISSESSKTQREAINQLRSMNRYAKDQGYLIKE